MTALGINRLINNEISGADRYKRATVGCRRVRRFSCRSPGGGRRSVDLDGGVDALDEEVGGVESDGAGHEPEREDHQEGVAEVEQGGGEVSDLQL